MIRQHSQKLRFHRERLMEESFVKCLFEVVHQQDGHSLVVVLRTTSSTNHLQHVCDGHVNVAL